jgi:hypothetical protein
LLLPIINFIIRFRSERAGLSRYQKVKSREWMPDRSPGIVGGSVWRLGRHRLDIVNLQGIMANLVARITIPTVKGSVLSMCGRTARLGGVIGATGLFGAHVLSTQPLFVKSQCQGFQWGG